MRWLKTHICQIAGLEGPFGLYLVQFHLAETETETKLTIAQDNGPTSGVNQFRGAWRNECTERHNKVTSQPDTNIQKLTKLLAIIIIIIIDGAQPKFGVPGPQ